LNNLHLIHTDLRDQWIINSLDDLNATHILELGCGGEERLQKKIISKFPNITYDGLDLLNGNDFLNDFPETQIKNRIIILEEVIEHLEEQQVFPLIKRIQQSGATHIIVTTPNREFTQEALSQKVRHPDHKFEWDEKELLSFISELHMEVRIDKIGYKFKGITPTWGLIITC
jgi:hypothetical protein